MQAASKQTWMDAMQERQRIDIVMGFNAGVNITHTYTEFKDKYDIFGKWIHTALEVTGVTNIVKDGLKSLFTSPKPFKIWPIVDLEWETIVYILKDAEPMSLEKSY